MSQMDLERAVDSIFVTDEDTNRQLCREIFDASLGLDCEITDLHDLTLHCLRHESDGTSMVSQTFRPILHTQHGIICEMNDLYSDEKQYMFVMGTLFTATPEVHIGDGPFMLLNDTIWPPHETLEIIEPKLSSEYALLVSRRIATGGHFVLRAVFDEEEHAHHVEQTKDSPNKPNFKPITIKSSEGSKQYFIKDKVVVSKDTIVGFEGHDREQNVIQVGFVPTS